MQALFSHFLSVSLFAAPDRYKQTDKRLVFRRFAPSKLNFSRMYAPYPAWHLTVEFIKNEYRRVSLTGIPRACESASRYIAS